MSLLILLAFEKRVSVKQTDADVIIIGYLIAEWIFFPM